MRADAKGAERERYACMRFESAPSDERGDLCGETRGARLAGTDGGRAVIGARGKPRARPASTGRQEQELDWCSPILDVLVPLQALLVSHGAGVPYSLARDAVGRQHDDQAALAGAVQPVVAKHSAFFTEWEDAIGLGVTLTAMQAAELDLFLRTIDRPLSLWEVFGSTLLILAPVLIPLAIYLLNLFMTKLRG